MLSPARAPPAWASPCSTSSACVSVTPCIGRSPLRARRAARPPVARRMRATCSVEHPPKPRALDAEPGQGAAGGASAGNRAADNGVSAPEPMVAVAAQAELKDFVVLEDVTLSYGGRKVLDGLNLRIRTGEGTAIIGPSGTGKSTTLRLICGLELPDSGRVVVKGWERKKRISEEFGPVRVSMVFQQAALFDSLTVCENVGFELFQHSSLPEERIVELVEAALARVGLAGVLDKYPGQLSGGMRKRVSFARAVMYDPEDEGTAPELILFDEPSGALDPTSSTRIENCIRTLQAVCPTYVVVTHELSTIRRTADRVVFLHDGKVQWDGPVKDIDTTTNPYVKQFMSASLEGPLADVQDFNHFEEEVMGESDI